MSEQQDTDLSAVVPPAAPLLGDPADPDQPDGTQVLPAGSDQPDDEARRRDEQA